MSKTSPAFPQHTSEIQAAYENRAYPSYVHPLADIGRLAAVARILGVEAADPRRARVLDLGCGSGGSLLSMAGYFPESRFTGLDFSGPDIISARALAADAGLTNVEFHHVDLLDWRPEPDAVYDYIIAYGVFSWVPDEVKERLLQLCGECLAPRHGIACVSYMTLPGCAQPDLLRDLLRLRAEAHSTPEAKIAAAREVLDFLDGAYGSVSALPHAPHMRDEVRRIRGKEPHFLLHDELGAHRDPCYLLQFVESAAGHGLRYLGESEFHMMLPENLPSDTARALAALGPDRLQTEQFMDFIVNRSFRCSLLTADAAGDAGASFPGLNAEAMAGLCLRPMLRPMSAPDPEAVEGQFLTQEGDTAMLRSLPLIASAHALAAFPQAFTPYPEVLSAAQRLAGREFTAREEGRLRADLLSLYGRRQLLLSGASFKPGAAGMPGHPRLSRLNHAFAARRAMLVTPLREVVPLTAAAQEFCALLDGSRTLEEMKALTVPGDSPQRLLEVFLHAGVLEA